MIFYIIFSDDAVYMCAFHLPITMYCHEEFWSFAFMHDVDDCVPEMGYSIKPPA